MKQAILFALLCLVISVGQAQRVPSWMNELPKAGNNTYVYVRESGEGATLDAALNQAMARVFQTTANRLGQPFDSQKINSALQTGTHYEVIATQYNIPINKVDQYDTRLKDNTYHVFVLCQVACAGNIQPVWDNMTRSGEAHNGVALLKSVFIPGLGQMGKGYYGEGIATLLGETLLVGSAVGCYFMAQNQLNIMNDYTTTYADYTAARNTYRTLQTTSYIAWGAAGALYIYNLVRATTMQPKHASGLAFAPSLNSAPATLSPSLSITLSF